MSARSLVEPAAAALRVDERSRQLIDKRAQGGDRVETKHVFLSGTVDSPLLQAAESDGDLPASNLREAWRDFVDLNLQQRALTEDFAQADLIHDNEMIIPLALEAGADRVLVVYPYLTLEPFMPVLT